MIKWSNALVTGIEMVDSSHQRIVELISVFVTTLRREGPDRGLVEATLTALAEHATTHFAEEEALMEFCALDSRHIRAHTREHQTFLDDIQQLAAQMDLASNQRINEIAEQLVRFMTAWLMLHIISMDKAMARQIIAIDSGSTPAAAYLDLQSDPHLATSSRVLLHSVLDLWRDAFDQCRRLEARLSALTPHSNSGVQLSGWSLFDQPKLATVSSIAPPASAPPRDRLSSPRASRSASG